MLSYTVEAKCVLAIQGEIIIRNFIAGETFYNFLVIYLH